MKLSKTMQRAIAHAHEGDGNLYRHRGGYWDKTPDTLQSPFNPAWNATWFGTSTIKALVKRGVATHAAFAGNSDYRFPVKVAVKKPEDIES